MATRSDEDVLAGILRIAVGGVEKLVPTLPAGPTRTWLATLGAGPDGFSVPVSDDDWTTNAVAEFSGLAIDSVLKMMVAYDRTGALGGREWLEENADPAQLRMGLLQMSEVAFPFATDVPRLLGALIARKVVGSSSPSSTSGRSPSGGLPRDHLKKRSTSRS